MLKIIIVISIVINLVGLSTAYAANDKKAVAEISMVIFTEIKGRDALKIHDKIYLNDRLIVRPSGIVRLRLPDSKEIELLEGDHHLIEEVDPSNQKQYLVLVTQKKRKHKQTIKAIEKDKGNGKSESQIDNADGQTITEESIGPQSNAGSDDNEETENNSGDGNSDDGSPDIPFNQPVCLENCGQVQTTLDPQQHPVDRTSFRIGMMTQKGFVLIPFEKSIMGIPGQIMLPGNAGISSRVMTSGNTDASGRIMAPGVVGIAGRVVAPGSSGVPRQVVVPGVVGVTGRVVMPGHTSAPKQVMVPSVVGTPGRVMAPAIVVAPGRTMVPSNLSIPRAIIPQGNVLQIDQNFSAKQNR